MPARSPSSAATIFSGMYFLARTFTRSVKGSIRNAPEFDTPPPSPMIRGPIK